MLDIFAIFSRGGIVLWFFQGNASLNPIPPVNALIKSVILQERVHQDLFNYENLSLKFKVPQLIEFYFDLTGSFRETKACGFQGKYGCKAET